MCALGTRILRVMGKLKTFGEERAKQRRSRISVTKELEIRGRAKLKATLVENRMVRMIDAEAVQRAAASLEGMAELLNEADPHMEVTVPMTVMELRHFVSYMRAVDELARDAEKLAEKNQQLARDLADCMIERDEAKRAHNRAATLQKELAETEVRQQRWKLRRSAKGDPL